MGPTLMAVAGVLLSGWVSVAAAGEIPPKAARALARAFESMKAGDLVRARSQYKRADELTEEPTYETKEGLSRILFLYGEHEKSLVAARLALTLAENTQQRAVTLSRIGALLFATSRPGLRDLDEGVVSESPREALLTEAQAAVIESIELSEGRFAMPWFNLSEIHYEKHQYLEAKKAIDRHLALMPEDLVSRRAGKLSQCLEVLTHSEDDASAPNRIKRLDEEKQVTRPTKISGPNPMYTEAARANRVQGTVIVESVITEQGEVVCTRPLKGLPLGLTRAATDSVSQWRFEPARLNGKPVNVYYNLTINFRLNI